MNICNTKQTFLNTRALPFNELYVHAQPHVSKGILLLTNALQLKQCEWTKKTPFCHFPDKVRKNSYPLNYTYC